MKKHYVHLTTKDRARVDEIATENGKLLLIDTQEELIQALENALHVVWKSQLEAVRAGGNVVASIPSERNATIIAHIDTIEEA